jgi:hypothetical protein
MEQTQKRIVQECFDGQYERDCQRCPAHYSRGGICCFGHRFEYDDDQCLSCGHNDACEPATYQLQEQRVERPRRSPSVSRRRLPIYGQSSNETKRNLLSEERPPAPAKRSQALSAPNDEVCYLPMRKPHEGKWEHFFKGMGLLGVWGAGEGALELMLGYLRRRRPE